MTLPSSIASSQDLTTLMLEIKNYANWFSHNEIKQRTGAAKGSPLPQLSNAGLELIRGWNGQKMLNQKSLDDLLAALERLQKTAHSMTVTLAAPPPKSLKQTLVEWCRQNIAADILITFQFNSTLGGGMVVRYGSHVFDWSFRRQILAARHNFPEVLRRV